MDWPRRSSVLLARTRLPAVAVAAVLAAAVGLVPPAASSATSAASPRIWSARFGSGGANGVVWLVMSVAGTMSAHIDLKRLPASTLVVGSVRRGTCSAQGAVVAALPSGRTSTAGRVMKRRSLTTREVAAYRASGSLVATICSGSVRRCAALVEWVAPTPSPAPVPTVAPSPTPAATATPTPTATASPGPPLQIGQRFLAGRGDAFWLRVDRVANGREIGGKNTVHVSLTIEARVDGTVIHADDFGLVEVDGTTHGPDALTPPWALATEKGRFYVLGLAYFAPAVGALDLRYGTLVIHVRN